ncbi:hypothetical protein TPHA_0N01100 [Tetrapisispora phaffii CBS 4417]|uniref:Zn(2)-C6 fungal-type domain-containing protein n=1 Tax=Tetrapisispora phaffii (strain ATCC 24235 / CBS 4417 / NBRC 1672 / NRRL Y-8282 / UCD 70-5) TaxID=1071381 RepID=G8C163_TETPH|nr:hypothetical protein TPHA_0N01100 [Tetrapisispora phaffii CBS 4417]CCE65891.1 hypothetical protein TPHA_0N01100 [Tetrapisispora phaffii CBS 4417]
MLVKNTNTRKFTGCWACRFKKKKCNEQRPQCTLCIQHGNHCSYDVKLIWLENNMYKLDTNSQMEHSDNIKETDTVEQYYNSNIISNDKNMADHVKTYKNKKFTISIRRLKIYDNAVPSVYGPVEGRDYRQDTVEAILDDMLFKLENISELDGYVSGHQGPFHVFSNNYKKSNGIVKHSVTKKTPSNVDTKIIINFIDKCVPAWIADQFEDTTQDNKNILIMASTSYIKRALLSNKKLSKIYFQLLKLNQKELIQNLDHYLKDTYNLSPVILMLLLIRCPSEVMLISVMCEKWILQYLPNKIEPYHYPLINLTTKITSNLKVLDRCYNILKNQSLNGDSLLNRLLVQVTERITQCWCDKVFQEMVSFKDASHSWEQMHYWETKLQTQYSIAYSQNLRS